MGVIHNTWETLWPIFILIPSIIFHYSFFYGEKRDPGILVPGGILLVISIIFFINTLFGWHLMMYLWPLFLFAVAFGLFELYLFGHREKALLIPIGILTGLGGIFLMNSFSQISYMRYLIPIGLIFLGLLLIIKKQKHGSSMLFYISSFLLIH